MVSALSLQYLPAMCESFLLPLWVSGCIAGRGLVGNMKYFNVIVCCFFFLTNFMRISLLDVSLILTAEYEIGPFYTVAL